MYCGGTANCKQATPAKADSSDGLSEPAGAGAPAWFKYREWFKYRNNKRRDPLPPLKFISDLEPFEGVLVLRSRQKTEQGE